MKQSFIHVCLYLCALCAACTMPAFADELYSKNKKANSLYQSKNYDGALKSYDNLILEFPAEQKLKMNKGSSLYRLGDFDKAEEAYGQAKEIKDQKALAALYYNLGNAQFMEGERLGAQNGQQAMEKYKAALENYIKSLDVRPSDRDAKWNVQLAQKKIKQMEQQQKQQNNKDNKPNKDNKDRNQDSQDKKKQDNKKQDQNKDQKNKEDKKQDQQQQNQQQDQNKKDQEKQKPEPTPQQQKQEDMKKDEAKRIIEQFSDDDKELNKKPEKIGVAGQKKVEKDW